MQNKNKRPIMLMILDGFGNSDKEKGNARAIAHMPVLDKIFKEYPYTELKASGEEVGLPKGQMGNSEVGHLNIGAGRIIYQDLSKINNELKIGKFYTNKMFLSAIQNVKEKGTNLHLLGLVSHGGVHSHISHLFGLLELAKKEGLEGRVFVHVILDGRDVAPDSGMEDIIKLEQKMNELQIGKIATISGRYYAMDRDKRWDRIKLAYDNLTENTGKTFETAEDAVRTSYEKGVYDEFVIPCNISGAKTIEDKDSVIFFNFRPDRARQLTRVFVDSSFNMIERKDMENYFVTMTIYENSLPNVKVAYGKEEIKNTLGEYVSKHNFNQLRIAETEKYAHVTYFLNGGIEEPFQREDRILVPSPKVATYDLKPEMSAYKVTEQLLEKLDEDFYDLIILNYANPDMVGHTGDIPAVVKALETIDECIEKVLEKIEEKNGIILITADHGNCEEMLEEDGGPKTSHTTNLVPFAIIGKNEKDLKLKKGKLSDIAPTILELFGLAKPEEMTGESLIINGKIK